MVSCAFPASSRGLVIVRPGCYARRFSTDAGGATRLARHAGRPRTGRRSGGLAPAPREDFPATREELRDVLRSLVERFFATLIRPEYLALMRVVIAETPRFPYLGELLKQMAPERMMKLVSTLLKRADERGIAEIKDVDAARRMLIGPFITYVFLDGLLAGDGVPDSKTWGFWRLWPSAWR